MRNKFISIIFLIIAPCLVVMVTVGSCHLFRDWLIGKGIVTIAGYTEYECLREAEEWVEEEDKVKAKKAIMKVFTQHWTFYTNENKAVWKLKGIFDEYGLIWDSWLPKEE